MSFSEALKKYRRSAGITQVELAKLLDTHQPIVSNFENGRAIPTGQEIEKIIEALKLNETEADQLRNSSGNPQHTEAPVGVVPEKQIPNADLTREFSTQILDLRNSIASLADQFKPGSGNDELISTISDMQGAISDLQKTSQGITAPVSLPSKEELQVRLISTVNFERLEEYRSGENKWFSFGCLFSGAICGILINLVTGASANSNTWIVGGTFFVMGILCFLSGYNYSNKASTLTKKLTGNQNG